MLDGMVINSNFVLCISHMKDILRRSPIDRIHNIFHGISLLLDGRRFSLQIRSIQKHTGYIIGRTEHSS